MGMCLESVVETACSIAEKKFYNPVVETPSNDNVAIFIILSLLSVAAFLIWWQYQGKHERRILTGASKHFSDAEDKTNMKVLQKIIKRRVTAVTNEFKDTQFITLVSVPKRETKEFKFHQSNVDSVCDNIYYYLTESRTSIHEHNFKIETRKI